jgi:hypothetical protein
MTTTTTHQNFDASTATPTSAPQSANRTSSALTARKLFLIACPVLAAAFTMMGALGDPGAGLDGEKMVRLYIDNPGPLQWKSTGYHWAYAFWIAPALLAAGLVRAKGAWLANIAAVIGFAGMTTLPGMLITDWYASAIGQHYGYEGVQAVESQMMDTMWGVAGFGIAGMAGFVLAIPLVTVALLRAGLVRWYAIPTVLAPVVILFISSGAVWAGAICAACLLVFATQLARAVKLAA